MMAKGVTLNAQGSEHGGAVQAAACGSDMEIMEILLEHKANVKIEGGQFGLLCSQQRTTAGSRW